MNLIRRSFLVVIKRILLLLAIIVNHGLEWLNSILRIYIWIYVWIYVWINWFTAWCIINFKGTHTIYYYYRSDFAIYLMHFYYGYNSRHCIMIHSFVEDVEDYKIEVRVNSDIWWLRAPGRTINHKCVEFRKPDAFVLYLVPVPRTLLKYSMEVLLSLKLYLVNQSKRNYNFDSWVEFDCC